MKDQVRIAYNVKFLTGIGTEYLLDVKGNVIAIFNNGYMNRAVKSNNMTKEQCEAQTVPLAA